MALWVVIHVDKKQDGTSNELRSGIVLPEQDAGGPTLISWEAETAGEAIQKAALRIREGGQFFATNYDTLIVATGVELQMQAIVPGIRAAGAAHG